MADTTDTLTALLELAAAIRDEQAEGQNTALRVGSLLERIVRELADRPTAAAASAEISAAVGREATARMQGDTDIMQALARQTDSLARRVAALEAAGGTGGGTGAPTLWE